MLPVRIVAATLFGTVYSESTNQRIFHAAIRLCDAGGTRLQDSITNDSGGFVFPEIPTGTYIVKVTASGYVPSETEVTVDFGTGHGVTIFLRPERQKSNRAAGAGAVSEHELSMPAAARRSMEAGQKKLYAEKNPAGALRDFQAAVAKAPDYYEAFYQMGLTYLALENSPDAEKSLQKAVTLSQQKFADADLALASLWLARHDNARGEPLLLQSLDLNPDSWSGYFQLGKLELYRNHLDAALQAAEKARALAPEQAMTYRLLSLIHMRQKNDPATLADLDAYLKLDSGSPEAATAKKIRADVQQRLAATGSATPANSKPR
ncbi:MAG TPA: carboxypeptidase regulatory-like domain-containing protein [Candidatus Dormibacteraeota bacterium]|nr:carboxypeptidase regulatory-like domain-containing protein [Candidatus Dormibacteraeota bacterium]